MADQSDDVVANLPQYRTQLEQVQELLQYEPDNQEYKELLGQLQEVIQLAEELQQAGSAAEPAEQATTEPSGGGTSQRPRRWADPEPTAAAAAARSMLITEAPTLHVASILPPQVAQQIRDAQQRAALTGQAPAAWAIGAKCQAVYSGDGEWYDATVTAVSLDGQRFVVQFDAYDDTEEVDRPHVRLRSSAEEVYRGVDAPKRKRVEDEPVITEMPKWLEVQPTDDPKARAKKKKLAKAYKSKVRFQEMDVAQRQRQQSWQDFKTGKGAKKKTGFLTGTRKESIFKVPDDPNGKVGVVGSGKGMTEYEDRHRHDFKADD